MVSESVGRAVKHVASVERARSAFDRKAWRDACSEFSEADENALLGPEDLERFAVTTFLIGQTAVSDALCARAHQAFLESGDGEQAARCAFWLGFRLAVTGEVARGGGWLARAQRLVDELGRDSVLSGYLLLPAGIRLNIGGDYPAARQAFEQAIEIGRRYGSAELMTIARHGQGRTLIRMGQHAAGLSLLDEVMVAVTTDEIPTISAGTIYCSVIDACHEILDLRRAQEWTDALARMCAAQPDLVPYRGHCLVRRAEMMQLHGEWSNAMDEATQAIDLFADATTHHVTAAAQYRRGELHRVRGEFAQAEEAYCAASDAGRRPHPGLALLRLAQRRVDDAAAAIRSVVAERQDRATRAHVLSACVEIMVEAGDLDAARHAAAELASAVETLDTPYLRALSSHGAGALLLADGQPQAALRDLRDAERGWRHLDAPYEAARVSVLIGLAHRALGDRDTAAIELTAACRAFEQLGATPELDRATELLRPARRDRTTKLTSREVEVLSLVAAGKTNRAIAETLGISEKTVARHVANIFTKLTLPNRAAATAYAYQNGLV